MVSKDGRGWSLSITGSGEARVTCELRSIDPKVLFDIQRQFLESTVYQD